MTQVLYGERLGKQGQLRLGCTAIIFDEEKRVLLTRRTDNGQWCLPGGAMVRASLRRRRVKEK